MSVRTNRKIPLLIVLFVLATAAPTFAGRIIYVDADASGAYDGSSWTDAFEHLWYPLAGAQAGDEIRVAQGIYIGVSFQLTNGVTIKGGYAGVGEPDPNARDVEQFETILKGDPDIDDETNFANYSGTGLHVIIGSWTDWTAVLDGFTITGGYAEGEGGGMYNQGGTPTLIYCKFIRNFATCCGGAIANNDTEIYPTLGGPTLIHCTFIENSTNKSGGAIYNNEASPVLINCTFIGNSAKLRGGGISGDSSPSLTNCKFIGNSAQGHEDDDGIWHDGHGGAIYHACCGNLKLNKCTFIANSGIYGGALYFRHEPSPKMSECMFIGNLAKNYGGAIYIQDFIHPNLKQCTFADNSAANGNALAGFPSSRSSGRPFNLKITNSILWDGGDEIWIDDGSTIEITYSDVEGGWLGEGNIDADPCFVEPGYWDADSVWIEGDYHLLPDSSCINAGDPNYVAEPNETDLDGNPRVIGGRIDMGAYEFQGPWYWYVDDDASNDPGPGDPQVSDPLEDGSQAHPFDAIQEAIVAAYDADVISVLDGTYTSEGWQNNPVIDFSGKAITVHSENGPENCILYSGNYVVRFRNGETNTSVLSGFTITGADPSAGIGCWNSSPTIMNNVITGNWSEYGLGSVLLHNSSALVIGNVITGNQVYGPCAGIYVCHGSSVTITNNTIVGNGGNGGWYGNGGVHCTDDSTATITNCIFWNNGDYDLYGCSATYSCLEHEHPGTGNIHSDPVFVNPGHWDNYSWVDFDYHLLAGSPCINAGAPDYTPQPNETDLDGKPRVVGGRIDMGAYESPVLLAELRIVPQTINLASKGNWITCYIWLPDQYNVADIDPNSIFLENEIEPEQFSVNEQQQVATAKFIREDVQPILDVGDIKLEITGQLMDGTSFKATDTIKVTSQKPPK